VRSDDSTSHDGSTAGEPTTDRPVQLRRWTAAEMADRLPDVMTVYRRAFLDVHEADPARAEADRAAHARTHVHRPGLRVVAALAEDPDLPIERAPLVGVAYGQPGARGQWWHDTVVAALPAGVAQEWFSDCFEVVELHVLPEYQGRGLGRRLLRELLDGCGRRTAALSALELPDSPARRLYASEGFVPLLRQFSFGGGGTPYAVLGKRLS
jgi:GNAT superfamily N-acetyltransferase